ncbi:MAG: hypothetical protein F4X15_10640 [Gemmatimonadetes bacterium]|nr:hypothetical protein [Gemmatimonadota bacterium]MYC91915.1 hypothetical protein [Gemmatimonadota bacterium]
MRARSRIISTLETVYREAYQKADRAGDEARMRALDFGFQRDQVMLEAILDVRDALSGLRGEEPKPESSLLDKAMAIRKFTKLGPR